MQIHLVGGFLGSGKTTAIIAAAQSLIAQGLRVGIITNDQGKYLVDTGFFQLADLPTVEVTGGCFCCNYDDLDARIDQLSAADTDVIFAESVGSCADLVATVIKPLQELGKNAKTPASFSVFTDCRLLRLRLLGEALPFNDDVNYIFDQQIEEAALLVVNKIDLLTAERLSSLKTLAAERYADKNVLFQSTLAQGGVDAWLAHIQSGQAALPGRSLDIDYQRYGAGEARLAWLDQTLTLDLPTGQNAHALLTALLEDFLAELRAENAAIGHLKLLAQNEAGEGCKISLTTLEEPGWQRRIPEMRGGQLQLLVNARVEMEAERLNAVFFAALQRRGVKAQTMNNAYFHPAQPNPTHRTS